MVVKNEAARLPPARVGCWTLAQSVERRAYTSVATGSSPVCPTNIKNMAIEHNPEKNHDAISIIKQPDGNYIGYMYKNGKLITARQGTPETVLVMLITHP